MGLLVEHQSSRKIAWEAGNEIHLIFLQGFDPILVPDDQKSYAIQDRAFGLPIARVCHQADFLSLDPFFKLKWPCSDRILMKILDALFLNVLGRANRTEVKQPIQKHGVRRLEI